MRGTRRAAPTARGHDSRPGERSEGRRHAPPDRDERALRSRRRCTAWRHASQQTPGRGAHSGGGRIPHDRGERAVEIEGQQYVRCRETLEQGTMTLRENVVHAASRHSTRSPSPTLSGGRGRIRPPRGASSPATRCYPSLVVRFPAARRPRARRRAHVRRPAHESARDSSRHRAPAVRVRAPSAVDVLGSARPLSPPAARRPNAPLQVRAAPRAADSAAVIPVGRRHRCRAVDRLQPIA